MKRATSIFLLIAGLACLWGAARAHRPLRDWRVDQSAGGAAALDRSSPLIVFTTVAIGGFRGMIADLLWMRAIRLQEEGKVFEMAQLADWIAKLEPRFTTVWAFNAWNLAYNISVRFPDPEDRWRWVKAGIGLLRDEGLKYNPRSAALHRELSWIYNHKIGFYMDTAHVVYKRKLAQEMAELFDGPRPDYRLAHQDPRLLRLKAEYKLDPAVMERIEREYGPLDWRLPAAHGLYWAYRGVQCAPDDKGDLACAHILCQCLAESFRHGRLVIDPRAGFYLAAPDLDLLPGVLRAYEEAIQKYPQGIILNVAYANFLMEAATILVAYNRVAEARDLYRRLADRVPEGAAPGFEDVMLGNMRIGVEQTPFRDAVALVEGFLVQHYTWAALGDAELAAGCERFACLVWMHLLAECPDLERWQRTGLAPLEDMRREAFRRALAEAPDSALAARLMLFAPDGVTDELLPAE